MNDKINILLSVIFKVLWKNILTFKNYLSYKKSEYAYCVRINTILCIMDNCELKIS